MFDSLLQDLRYGARSLVRTPGFTIAAIVALALGIGANSAILSVVSGVLLKPLSYEQPDRLVTVLDKGYNGLAPGTFLDLRRQLHSFTQLGAAEYWTPAITGVAEPEKLYALRLSSDVLPMLGVSPALGRVWTTDEDATGREHEVVIGHGLWVRRFASDSNVLGKSVILDGNSYTVIGVMPRGFGFAPFWATRAELWAPLALDTRAGDYHAGSLRVFGRLKPATTIAAAQSEVTTLSSQLEQLYPGTTREVRVTDLTTQVVGKVRTPLLIILGAVAFVLLIACANVAHMLLARAARRQREIAVRVAIGATRARMIAQLLTESVLLALLGGIAGLGLAEIGVRVLAAQGASSIPRVETITLDPRVLLATAFITLLTGVAFGLAPAVRASNADLTSSLKEGERGSTEGRKNRTRSVLIASEFALALMLLVGAGLLIRSFVAMQSLNPGYDPANVLTMVVPVTGTSSSPEGKRAAFYDALLGKIRAMPGVQSASAVNHIPIGGDNWGIPFRIEGRPEPKPRDLPSASYKVVMPGYFATMRIPLLAGRDVSADDKMDAPRVVVINELLATRYWPGENPLGKRLSFGVDSSGARIWATVVGVVHNTIHGDWTAPPDEETFLPFAQQRAFLANPAGHYAYMSFALRAACAPTTKHCDPTALVPALRAAVHELDPNVPLSEVQPMSSLVDGATARERFYLMLLTAFATVAVALAAVGIYGVMSYAVSRRTHELGLRMALGARPQQLLVSVVRDGMIVAAIGGAIGVIGALAISRLMATLLFGVKATDPLTFVAVATMLGVIALVACYIPARRATKIDPLEALRAD
ncbi:MAG TPA: ABC transporter permease [Gemmatimonadaceae bacterium]|nr:ABC transporter permease [Gemmatimonadaceae bacterium]